MTQNLTNPTGREVNNPPLIPKIEEVKHVKHQALWNVHKQDSVFNEIQGSFRGLAKIGPCHCETFFFFLNELLQVNSSLCIMMQDKAGKEL